MLLLWPLRGESMAISVNQLLVSQARDVLLEVCRHEGYLYLSEEKGVLRVSCIPKPQGFLARLWLYIRRLFDRGFNLDHTLIALGERFKVTALESNACLLGDMYVNVVLAYILAEEVNQTRSWSYIDLTFLDQVRLSLFVALHAKKRGGKELGTLVLDAKMRAVALLCQKQLSHYPKIGQRFAAIIEQCSREEVPYKTIRAQFLGILQQVKTAELRPLKSLIDRLGFEPPLRGLVDAARVYRRAAKAKELPASPQKRSILLSIVGELMTDNPDDNLDEVIDILDQLPPADTQSIYLAIVRRLVVRGERRKALAQIPKMTQPADPAHDQALLLVCQELQRGSLAEALTFIEENMKGDVDKRFALLFFAPHIDRPEDMHRLQSVAHTLAEEAMRRALISDLDHIWATQFK